MWELMATKKEYQLKLISWVVGWEGDTLKGSEVGPGWLGSAGNLELQSESPPCSLECGE